MAVRFSCSKKGVFFLAFLRAFTVGQICFNRYENQEWISHGDCLGENEAQAIFNDIIQHLSEEIAADEGRAAVSTVSTTTSDFTEATNEPDVVLPPCHGVQLDQIPSVLRNVTGGEISGNVPEIGPTKMYCDVTTDGGNWVVFQRRMDGSVDFNRKWADYVNGFGNVRGEHWLGLEALHQLTKNGSHEIRIDMIDRNGVHHLAKYSSFSVGPSTDKYRLSVSGHSGNVTDSFAETPGGNREQNGQQFSTLDSDNDDCRGGCNCATSFKGGGWYKWCASTNLNGRFDDYTPKGVWAGVFWHTKNDWLYMKFVEMKLRKKV